MFLGSRAAFTPILLTCYAITLAVHVGSIALSATGKGKEDSGVGVANAAGVTARHWPIAGIPA